MNTFQTVNPDTESPIQEYRFWTTGETSIALQESEKAYKNWRKTTLQHRVILVEKLASVLELEIESLALQMTNEMGKPITESRGELSKCALLCRYYAENAPQFLSPKTIITDTQHSYLRYDPIGTILGIMPWNFPFWQVFRCAIPALLAGNTFILKHALNVMGCAVSLEELFLKAGFPKHLFLNAIVKHELIPAIIEHRQCAGVALTGSLKAGKAVAKLAGAAIKPTVLELGGSDAFIVLEDCDIDDAVNAGIFSRMLNNGQSCIAAKRFLVQASVHDIFVEKMVESVRKIKLGHPTNPSTQMGPLARPDLLKTLNNQVERTLGAGANLVFRHPFERDNGYFFPPVIVNDINPSQPLFVEETFGPVVAISTFETLDDAVEISNQSQFGLGATIWTDGDVADTFIAQLDVGTVAINGFVKSDPRLPFGGTKKSGFGRELSESGIKAFVNEKTVSKFK